MKGTGKADMLKWILVLIIVGGVTNGLVSCGGLLGEKPGEAPGAGTAAQTLLPAPEQPAGPEPGIRLTGPIELGDRAKQALITINISPDGKSVSGWGVYFEELECETFTTGTLAMQQHSPQIITEMAFEDQTSNIGDLVGRITSPTTASGTIHLKFDLGFGGTIECGIWNWSAEKSGMAELITPPPIPEEPTEVGMPTIEASEGFPTIVPEMQPVPPDKLQVVNDTLVESEDKVYVNGEVKNLSETNIEFIRVTARLLDANGNQVADGFSFGVPGICPPGELAAFSVMFDKPANYQGYELELEAMTTSAPPFTELHVVGEFSKTDEMGMQHIFGIVENTGTATLEHSSLYGVLYDENGKVVSVTISPPASPNWLLTPGEKAIFDLIPYPFETQYNTYRLILEGIPSAKSPPPKLSIDQTEKIGDQLVGKVTFPGPGSATIYSITAVFFDAEGNIIDYSVGITRPQDLAAGESATFELLMIPSNFDHYEVFTSYIVE